MVKLTVEIHKDGIEKPLVADFLIPPEDIESLGFTDKLVAHPLIAPWLVRHERAHMDDLVFYMTDGNGEKHRMGLTTFERIKKDINSRQK